MPTLVGPALKSFTLVTDWQLATATSVASGVKRRILEIVKSLATGEAPIRISRDSSTARLASGLRNKYIFLFSYSQLRCASQLTTAIFPVFFVLHFLWLISRNIYFGKGRP